LEEIQKDGKSTGLLTEQIGNDGSRSVDSLLDITIIVELGQSVPGTSVVSSLDHDNMAFTFGAESLQSFSHEDHRSRSLLVRQKAGAEISFSFAMKEFN
jgi:hypothetical protein